MSDETNTPLIGKLIEAGNIKYSGEFPVHGILIDCGKDALRKAKIPLYADVMVIHSQSTPGEILEFMYKGIPLKTLKEVHEGLGKMLDQTS